MASPRLQVVGEDGFDAQPWERMDREPGVAYGHFLAYRDAGPRRSLARVGSERGLSAGQVGHWSRRWRWYNRAIAWDAHAESEWRADQAEAVKTMRRGHAALATMVVAKAAQRLRDLDPRDLTVREAALLFVEGTKAERVARGEPAETTEVSVSASGMTGAQMMAALRANPRLGELADALADIEDGAQTIDATVRPSDAK